MEEKRYLEASITEDLEKKMVFLAGPRQVGKTTLARQILERTGSGIYLNWDRKEDRREIRAARWPGGKALVVLDELHKWRGWKRWIKGEFDTHQKNLQFLVTGSARMDVYRRGGDSLQGRYHHYRLHPFTCREITGRGMIPTINPGHELEFPSRGSRDTVEALMQFSGFPEPILAQSSRTLRRWQKERLERFFREDVRDLENVRDLSSLQILSDLLPERVGSPLSLNALREDLEVSHRAVTHWMDILERLYFVFRVRPYTSRQAHSLQKMPKAYLWDSSLVEEEGPRLENLVALHLLKFCHFLEDSEGYKVQLHYLRDRAGREVDFLVSFNRDPWFAVEVKVREAKISPALNYFRNKLQIPWAYQVVLEGTRDFVQDGVRCLPAHRFLPALS